WESSQSEMIRHSWPSSFTKSVTGTLCFNMSGPNRVCMASTRATTGDTETHGFILDFRRCHFSPNWRVFHCVLDGLGASCDNLVSNPQAPVTSEKLREGSGIGVPPCLVQ